MTGYYLHIGTSPGTGNLVNMGVGTNTSATVTLPTNGATIYVQLETHFGWTILKTTTHTPNSRNLEASSPARRRAAR